MAEARRRHPDREYRDDGRLVIRGHYQREKILREEKYVDYDKHNPYE